MTERRFLVVLMALLVALTAVAAAWIWSLPGRGGLTSFRSYSELRSYLDGTFGRFADYSGGSERMIGIWSGWGAPAPIAAPAEGPPDYSGTNVQVSGVDELDIVKTDGRYLYIAAGEDAVIVRAVPATEMEVVARIPAPDANTTTLVVGTFVAGDRLMVISSVVPSDWYLQYPVDSLAWAPPADSTLIRGYDITDAAQPALEFSHSISGSPLAARMIPPCVYLVANAPVVKVNQTYEIPQVCEADTCAPLAPERIFYDATAQESSTFTNVLAVDVETGEANPLSILTGHASTVYMSTQALYLTYTKWGGAYGPIATQSVPSVRTTIHKVKTHGIVLEATASADVPGRLLNQFSLDEHEGHLRVFTTVVGGSFERFTQENNLYVLDEALVSVGRLEGLAPGEEIHSARFLGDRAYLVTFQKIDPFFVIDLSDPRAPQVLGFLKIPGYSDYLHPMGGDHVLGIGKDTLPGETDAFSWYQGLKLSLFNASDVENPTELSTLVIGDRGTESAVLRDHKAFLSIPSRGLVVLPVHLAVINESRYPEPIPPYAYGDLVWQGAYVLRVTVRDGIAFVGRIAHGNVSVDEWGYARLDWAYEVARSVYIGDTLYTISPSMVKANALDGLSEVGSLVYE